MSDALARYRMAERQDKDALKRYKDASTGDTLGALAKYLGLRGYWDRQGQIANESLQMADEGAQAVRGGNFSGLPGLALGPLRYIGSPVEALFPQRSEVEAATDIPNWSKPWIAGGLETMAIMAPGPKTRGLNNIRMPSRDALNSASGATFQGRVLEQPTTMSIDALTGGVRTTDPTEVKRVSDLAAQISGPQGYFERIMVDTSGNVIEGQHRLEALRKLGISDVPVVVLRGADEGLDTAPMLAAAKGAGVHPEQAQQIVDSIGEIIAKGDSPLDYDPPRGFEAAWNAAVKAHASRDRGLGKGMAPGPKGKGLGRGMAQLADDATDAERAALAGRMETEAAQAAPEYPWLKPSPQANFREAAALRMQIEPLETQLKNALQSKNATKAATLREKLKVIRDRVAKLSPGGPLLSAERVDEILKAHPNADLSAEDISKMFPDE